MSKNNLFFLGIDHGTTAIRFSWIRMINNKFKENYLELCRYNIRKYSINKLKYLIEKKINYKLSDINTTVMTYSMGDGITKIENIKNVKNRGLTRKIGMESAGIFLSSGTKIYDLICICCKNVFLVPGVHRNTNTDIRLKVYSHQASPDKVSALYYISKKGYKNFILSDIGANTVSLAVCENKILGGLDACIFAPGFIQGPIDLEGLRKIDYENITANNCFSNSGVLSKFKNNIFQNKNIINDTISLFAAMEIISLSLLLREKKKKYHIFISGTGSENKKIIHKISEHLNKKVIKIGK